MHPFLLGGNIFPPFYQGKIILGSCPSKEPWCPIELGSFLPCLGGANFTFGGGTNTSATKRATKHSGEKRQVTTGRGGPGARGKICPPKGVTLTHCLKLNGQFAPWKLTFGTTIPTGNCIFQGEKTGITTWRSSPLIHWSYRHPEFWWPFFLSMYRTTFGRQYIYQVKISGWIVFAVFCVA